MRAVPYAEVPTGSTRHSALPHHHFTGHPHGPWQPTEQGHLPHSPRVLPPSQQGTGPFNYSQLSVGPVLDQLYHRYLNPAPEWPPMAPSRDLSGTRPPHLSSRFPVRGILRKSTAPVAPAEQPPNRALASVESRVRFSSPQEFVFPQVPSNSPTSMQSYIPQRSTPSVWSTPPAVFGPPQAASAPCFPASQVQPGSYPSRMSGSSSIQPSLCRIENGFSVPPQRWSRPQDSQYPDDHLMNESPHQLSRSHISTPLSNAHDAILAEAAASEPVSRPTGAAGGGTKRGKAMIRALEEAVESNGYESDELNLRPRVKSEVSPPALI